MALPMPKGRDVVERANLPEGRRGEELQCRGREEVMVAGPRQKPEAQRLGSALHDLSIRISLSCLQLLILLQGGHRRFCTVVLFGTGASAQQYLRALEFLPALLALRC